MHMHTWKTHVVFIKARNALSTEYHFRGTSYHCNEPRFMLKCTRCAHTCHTTNHRTTTRSSAYSAPLAYFTSDSLSRNLGVDVPLIFRADYRGKRALAPGQFSAGGRIFGRRTILSTFEGRNWTGTSGWKRVNW